MKKKVIVCVLAVPLLWSLACSDSDNPTAPQMVNLTVANSSVSVGGQTLQEFDRVGATLDLPNFGRWVAGGEQID